MNPLYLDHFQASLLGGIEILLLRVRATAPRVEDEDRQQAWHLLSYSLEVATVWPMTQALLLALAPPMELAGFREDWLPYLEAGFAQGVALLDRLAAAELALHIGVLKRLLGQFDQAHTWLGHCTEQLAAHEQDAVRAALQAKVWLELSRLALDVDRRTALELAQQSLALYRTLDEPRGLAIVYQELGNIARQLGNYGEAQQMFTTSLHLWQTLQEPRGIADALHVMSLVKLDLGELVEAIYLTQQRMDLCQRIGDRSGLASAYQVLGLIHSYAGDYPASALAFEESLSLWRRLGDHRQSGRTLTFLGNAKGAQGLYTEACMYGELGLAQGQAIHNQWGIAQAYLLLGWNLLGMAAYPAAEQYLQTSLNLFRQLGQRNDISQTLVWLAYGQLGQGNTNQAAQYLRTALQIAQELKTHFPLRAALPALAVWAMQQGKIALALAWYTAAKQHPVIANAQVFTDLAGQAVAQAALRLSPGERNLAKSAGQALRLHAVIAQFLREGEEYP
ncbi:MAG: tetratricopeptide repeat protein [Caldilineaceae bacterium]